MSTRARGATKRTNSSALQERVDVLLVLLTRLTKAAYAREVVPKDYGTGRVLHRAEIHTIQAIGRHRGLGITELARSLGVTKGAASQMVSKLVRLGLVSHRRELNGRRNVQLDLTELGERGFQKHEQFHEEARRAVCSHFGRRRREKLEQAIDTLENLLEIIEGFATTRGHS